MNACTECYGIQHQLKQKIVLTDHQKLPLGTPKLREIPYATPPPFKQIQKNTIILKSYI